jgi:hypothetical protein
MAFAHTSIVSISQRNCKDRSHFEVYMMTGLLIGLIGFVVVCDLVAVALVLYYRDKD